MFGFKAIGLIFFIFIVGPVLSIIYLRVEVEQGFFPFQMLSPRRKIGSIMPIIIKYLHSRDVIGSIMPPYTTNSVHE